MPRLPAQEILDRAHDIHRVSEEIVKLADSAYDLSQAEGKAFLAACKRYSKDKPLQQVVKVTPTDGQYIFLLPDLVDGWNVSFRIQRIQYPIRQNEYWFDSNAWRQKLDIDTKKMSLQFLRNQPTEPFAIWYFRPHFLDNTNFSIPEEMEEAISQLTAGYVLEQAANLTLVFAEKSPFQASGVDYKDIPRRYREAADRCFSEYNVDANPQVNDFSPCFGDLDFEQDGESYIFHPSDFH